MQKLFYKIITIIFILFFTVFLIVDLRSNENAKQEDESKIELDIEYPNAIFSGTKEPIEVDNLRKLDTGKRPSFFVPAGTTNVALGKPVTSSDDMPFGKLELITDGDKEAVEGSFVELAPFLQNITIDLESVYEIFAISIWHYHLLPRVYFDVIVQACNDPDFITNVTTLFNNDIDNSAGFGVGSDMHYIETNKGELIYAKGIKARYLRLYSKGNSSNDMNHYIEVEVYGRNPK